jgi:transcriptional regulator with XRE-family HTH domain
VISEIGKNIRKLSKQDGLSQQLIFKLFDISNNTGIKLESGGNTEPLIIALQK